MKLALQLVSLASLGLNLTACILFFQAAAPLPTVQSLLLIGTIGWFASAPFWMEHKRTG